MSLSLENVSATVSGEVEPVPTESSGFSILSDTFLEASCSNGKVAVSHLGDSCCHAARTVQLKRPLHGRQGLRRLLGGL